MATKAMTIPQKTYKEKKNNLTKAADSLVKNQTQWRAGLSSYSSRLGAIDD